MVSRALKQLFTRNKIISPMSFSAKFGNMRNMTVGMGGECCVARAAFAKLALPATPIAHRLYASDGFGHASFRNGPPPRAVDIQKPL